MDKRNLKKTEKTRTNDKKDRGDLKRVEKQVKKNVDSDTNDGKVHPDGGDLKKVDKQTKKPGDSDTNNTKIPPDRGDLRKTEKQAKRIVDSDVKVHEDRGDLKKSEKQANKTVDSDTNDAKLNPDRGESDRKIFKIDKPKLNVIIKKSDDKTKNLEHRASRENIKKLDTDTVKAVADDKRKTREKYNLKLKNPPIVITNVNKKEEQQKLGNYFKPAVTEVKNDRTPKKPNDTAKEKSDESNESKKSITIFNIIKSDKKEPVHRKPIIRTIASKNDTTKMYKAVTFVDQKKTKPTMLQIKIPNDAVKNHKNISTETIKKVRPTQSGDSVKEKSMHKKKPERRKTVKSHRHVASPELSLKVRSPPTEVAKWAPSSINRHTKPYYEAWVNTTLAAISKNSKKDKLFMEKQNILQSFQRALAERPETPELVYENFTDERYTGRIKVKQK